MHFRELQVWQKAKSLAVDLYAETREGQLARDFGVRDQMRRAAVSIASNIAEGYGRETVNDRCHFMTIAKGSCAELQTQLEIAHETGLLLKEKFALMDGQCDEVARMLSGLIRSLRAGS